MSTSVAACPVQLLLPCRHFFHSWHLLKLFLSHFHCHFHTSCHTSATHDIFSNCYCHTFTVTFILLVILLPLMTSFQTALVTLSLNVTFACNKTDKFILISIRFVVTLPSLLILLKLPVTIPLLQSVCNHHFVMVLLIYFSPLRYMGRNIPIEIKIQYFQEVVLHDWEGGCPCVPKTICHLPFPWIHHLPPQVESRMVMASIRVQQEEQAQVWLLLQAWLLLPRLIRRGTGQPAWIDLVATLTNKNHQKTMLEKSTQPGGLTWFIHSLAETSFLFRMQLKAESPEVQAHENRVRETLCHFSKSWPEANEPSRLQFLIN